MIKILKIAVTSVVVWAFLEWRGNERSVVVAVSVAVTLLLAAFLVPLLDKKQMERES